MQQLTLSLEAGLSSRWDSLRECVATQVYNKGHGRVCVQLDLSPSKLSEKLAGLRSDGKASGLTLDEFERYLATGDKTPLLYLVDKYLSDPTAQQAVAMAKLQEMLQNLPQLIALAGVATAKRQRA